MKTAGWMFQELYRQPSALAVCSCCTGTFSTGMLPSICIISSLWKPAFNLYQKWENCTTKWSLTLSGLWEKLILVKIFPQQLRHFWQVPTMIPKWNNDEFFTKISFLVSPLKLKESHCSPNACDCIIMHHCMGMKDTIFTCLSK